MALKRLAVMKDGLVRQDIRSPQIMKQKRDSQINPLCLYFALFRSISLSGFLLSFFLFYFIFYVTVTELKEEIKCEVNSNNIKKNTL
mmetsp:Transcript_34056/g.43933  ORF Transcript_34056/g.43933 Transcript_34056/m.43933 type:complete len:87 (+) Transcript_34056:1564-1824(+)